MIAFTTQHRHIFLQLTKRLIQQRYKGSILGFVWAFATPLITLAIYSFVFSVILMARWETEVPFAVMLFIGLIIHGFFMESLQGSATVVTTNTNYVKKVIFPLAILVPAQITAALFQLVIGFVLLILITFVLGYTIHLTALIAPFILVPFILLTLGVCWLLASLGVFIRDITQLLGLLGTLLLFISTIIIPPWMLPEEFGFLIYLNPLSFVVDSLRGCLFDGTLPDIVDYGVYSGVSVVIAVVGLFWFQKTRKGFADVL